MILQVLRLTPDQVNQLPHNERDQLNQVVSLPTNATMIPPIEADYDPSFTFLRVQRKTYAHLLNSA